MNQNFLVVSKSNLIGLNIVKIFFYLGLVTASFDIFMVFSIGFNFRASQFFLTIPIFVSIVDSLTKGKVRWPLGFLALLTWTFFIFLFIPNTNYLLRSLGYGFWLLFNVLLVFTAVKLFDNYKSIISLMKCYIYSFFFVALFGLFQFTLPIFGIDSPLVTQWWIQGILPRINGFSYEPSYFATYLLIGWVLSSYLLAVKSNLIKRQLLKTIFLIETLALFLSSSRMGWVMMLVWSLQYPILFFYRLIKGEIASRYFKYSLILIAIIGILFFFIIKVLGIERILFLLSGLGIAGSSSHSTYSRFREFLDTFQIFLNSPIIGYSLGGVSSAIGELRGIDVTSFDDAKNNEGMSVFTEVLAASGIIGFIPFALYIVKIVIKPIKISKKILNMDMRNLLKAMAFALIVELIILQFNQTILRLYLWLHIAILSAIYSVVSNSMRRRSNDADNFN